MEFGPRNFRMRSTAEWFAEWFAEPRIPAGGPRSRDPGVDSDRHGATARRVEPGAADRQAAGAGMKMDAASGVRSRFHGVRRSGVPLVGSPPLYSYWSSRQKLWLEIRKLPIRDRSESDRGESGVGRAGCR